MVIEKDYVSIRDNVNWDKLRKIYFKECTDQSPLTTSMTKINLAPHDLFEWFKNKIEKDLENEDGD